MKKAIATGFAFVLLAAPAFSLADAFTPLQLQIEQLTAVVASLEAQILGLQGKQLACAVVASKTSVQVNEQFALAWGSVGAMDAAADPTKKELPQNGSEIIALDKVGTWSYALVFASLSGATTSCMTKIIVQ